VIGDLAPERIASRLTTRRFGRSLEVKERTGSTNDDARVAGDAGVPDGHVIVADAQDAGRGSHGRAWSSPPGTDLYFSIVTRVDLPPARIPPLTLAAGLGVARAVEALAFTRASIKWPNDVWIGEPPAKCAGILVETSTTGARAGAVVIGIGVNVNRREWPAGLASPATSIANVAGGLEVDRADALAAVLARVEDEVDRFVARGPQAIVPDVDERLLWRGEIVLAGNMGGELLGLAPSGGLLIREARSRTVVEVVSGPLVR
jgi:BirA family biotin operon repressor/biotin-[acetyl-CoA-carboxylase] ligase